MTNADKPVSTNFVRRLVRTAALLTNQDPEPAIAGFNRWLDAEKGKAFQEGVEAHRKYDYPENPYREDAQ